MVLTDMLAQGCGEMRNQEPVMSTSKDQVRGRVKEAKGKSQNILGNAQAKFGDVKQRVKE